jgi:alkaline phosphatase
MARYVDGFVIPFPKKNLAGYRAMAKIGARVWRKHGALEYFECVGDDLKTKGMLPFTRLAKTKPGETVAFSFIVYKSRAHRDQVNKKVMADKALAKMMGKKMPFEMKRMAYGGFKVLVEG